MCFTIVRLLFKMKKIAKSYQHRYQFFLEAKQQGERIGAIELLLKAAGTQGVQGTQT